MDSVIELVNDGDGIAVIGDAKDVVDFLSAQGLASVDLRLDQLGPQYTAVAGTLHAGAAMAANSGRWLRLTEESAQAMKLLPMVKNAATGNLHATLRASSGQFAKNLQFLPTSPVAVLTNPAMLIGAAAMMQQYALQAALDDINEYLAVIDAKIDDILRAQQDAVFADLIGVDLVIQEAMTIRDQVGRVSDVTWSKVQGTSFMIARTQAYSLRSIEALVQKVNKQSKVGDVAQEAKLAESKVQEWLTVLARCCQLQDATAVLELDRILDGSPEDLEKHRLALKTARDNRLASIHRATESLLDSMNDAARRANSKVLLAPVAARAAVESSSRVNGRVLEFQTVLGIEDGYDSVDAKRWRRAVGEVRDNVLKTGTEGAVAAKEFGDNAIGQAKSTAGRLSTGISAFRRAMKDTDPADPA